MELVSQQYGVMISNVSRSYGRLKIIENITMKVPRGTIYGLLGPSGCGKTTLLKLILGRLDPDNGKIEVLGAPPHTKNHYIPGSRVGYAPQELALYTDLSISETFQFYGSLHGMSTEEYKHRKKWLINFLELPDEKRVINKLSGGQQRRVSLAVALLHNPEILILDEPTVGLDPLLRLKIWDHLREITLTGVTIIITTHYIEEARQANTVGLMRNGKLLEEGNPEFLMHQYGHNNLEDVFLDLCRGISKKQDGEENLIITEQVQNFQVSKNDNQKQNEIENNENEENHNENDSLLESFNNENSKKKIIKKRNLSWKRHPYHIFAISRRKMIQLIRNPIALLFEILVPTIEIFLFILCVGPDPKNLSFSVVNFDVGYTPPFLFGYLNLGNQTVEFLKKDSFLNIHEFNNLEAAINSVKEGKNWGVLYIDREFSKAFFWKYYSTKNETIQKDSTMDLYLDLSDYQISLVIGERLQKAFEDSVMKFTNASVNPIKIMKPIYGKRDSKFSTFLAPGVIAVIAFSHSIGLTAIAFIREKTESTMDRIFASGVKVPIIIIAHFVTHSIILFIQVALLFAIAIFAFKISVEGYFVTAFTLLLFLGLVGMSLGLVISSISYQEMEAIQISLACVFPSLLMSGILWPKEAIPSSFQWVSNSLPTTWTASALRSIMIRGWNIQHKEIYYSYFISLAWIISLLFFASWRLNSRDKQKKWWFFKQKKQISPINLPLINENISVDRD